MTNNEPKPKLTAIDVILAGGYLPCHECGIDQPEEQPSRAVTITDATGPICKYHSDKYLND